MASNDIKVDTTAALANFDSSYYINPNPQYTNPNISVGTGTHYGFTHAVQAPVSVYTDDDGKVIAVLADGHLVDISTWGKRQILESIKAFLEDVVNDEYDPGDDLVRLVSLKTLFGMYKEEVEMAEKYLDLCERFIYEKTCLADLDSDLQEEAVDGEFGAEDALP